MKDEGSVTFGPSCVWLWFG